MAELSVIIPVYNRILTLEKAVKSVLDQTFDDFELILIDDGSTDGSGELCDKFANIDHRIKVFHQENAGVSSARNLGIEKSTCKYIAFVDSDDYILPAMYDTIINKMIDLNTLVICGIKYKFYNFRGEPLCANEIKTSAKTISRASESYIDTILDLLQGTLIHSVYNKIFVSSIISRYNLRFDTSLPLGEDLVFNMNYILHINHIEFIEDCFYQYVSNENDSSVSKYRSNKFELVSRLYEEVKKFTNNFEVQHSLESKLFNLYIKWVYSCYISLFSSNCPMNRKQRLEFIQNTITFNDNALNKGALKCLKDSKKLDKILVKAIAYNKIRIIYLYAFAINVIKFRFNSFYNAIIKIKNGK